MLQEFNAIVNASLWTRFYSDRLTSGLDILPLSSFPWPSRTTGISTVIVLLRDWLVL